MRRGGVWGRDDFQPRNRPKKEPDFQKTLDCFLESKPARRSRKVGLSQEEECKKYGVQYDPPIEGESVKQRNTRRQRNWRRIRRQKEKANEKPETDPLQKEEGPHQALDEILGESSDSEN